MIFLVMGFNSLLYENSKMVQPRIGSVPSISNLLPWMTEMDLQSPS